MPDETTKDPIPFGRPWIAEDDKCAVLSVFDSPILTHGPRNAEFEQEFSRFLGGGHCVTTSSCTAGMHLFYIALGIGEGDEVVMPAISHVATAHVVEITGARPTFVDCERETGNMNADAVQAAITPNTKAICAVHFNGMPADMTRIVEIAGGAGIPVLEDCATALGAERDGTKVGLFGDGASFSFYPAKHITTGEGGMFVSRHSHRETDIRRLRAFSYDRTLENRNVPGIYDVNGLGLNYRMSEFQAALGTSQLSRMKANLEMRSNNFDAYAEALGDMERVSILSSKADTAIDANYCLTLMLADADSRARNGLLLRLSDRGIGTSVHYPHPLPRLAYYQGKYGYTPGSFPNSEAISDRSFNLPLAPHIGSAEIDRIVETLKLELDSLTS